MTQVFRLTYLCIAYTVQHVFAHELREYNKKGEAMSTGMKIIGGLFGKHCIVGLLCFVIPSIYGCRRIRNRIR